MLRGLRIATVVAFFVMVLGGFIFVSQSVVSAGFAPEKEAGVKPLNLVSNPVGPVNPQADTPYTPTMYIYLPLLVNNWPPLPSVPTLYKIETEPLADEFEVSWSLSESDTPVVYTLQEAKDPYFTNPVWYTTSVTNTMIDGKSHAVGIYYYQVRATNQWGHSTWSNIESVSLLTRRDDFNDPVTGWMTRRTSSPDFNLVRVLYEEGELITRVDDRFDFGVYSPMIKAPELPYRITMHSKIIHYANEVSYGIVFGGDGGSICPVNRETSGSGDGCFYHYYRLNVIWGGFLKFDVKRINYHEGEKGKGRGDVLMSTHSIETYKASPNSWNMWTIDVYEDGFQVAVNGNVLGWTNDTRYIDDPYYGIFSSTYEYNSATFRHSHYYVEPISGESSLPAASEGYKLPGSEWYVPIEDANYYLMDVVTEVPEAR